MDSSSIPTNSVTRFSDDARMVMPAIDPSMSAKNSPVPDSRKAIDRQANATVARPLM